MKSCANTRETVHFQKEGPQPGLCVNDADVPKGRSDGQALAALGAASVDDLAAILAGHTLQETMNGTALTLLRLESLFHFTYPPVPILG